MAKFTVMITRSQTVESFVEIEVSAKDEESAQAKAEEKINKAIEADKLDDLNWEESDSEDTFEYEASFS